MPTPARRGQPACRTADPEVFFPPPGGSTLPALAYCHLCPVRPTCLDEALARPDEDGIRGGTTPMQRALARRGRPIRADGRPDRATQGEWQAALEAARAALEAAGQRAPA